MADDVLHSQDRDELHAEIARLEQEKRYVEADIRELDVELNDLTSNRDAYVKQRARERSFRHTMFLVIPAVVLIGGGALTVIIARYLQDESHTGRVTMATGSAPSDIGDPCTVRFEPAYFPYNAYMQVDCGNQRLYGYASAGYGQCDTEDSLPTHCTDSGPIDHDGDPHILFDRSVGTFELDDGPNWKIVIELDDL